MQQTYPNVTVTNLELTPMQVNYQGPTDVSTTDLGGTLGNVVISTKYMKANIMADQLGETVLNRRVSGFQMTVTTALAEIENKKLFKIIWPHGQFTPAGTKYFQWNSNIGDDDLSNAGVLNLHPIDRAPSDVSFDITCFKVCASAESEITFGPKDQAKAKIVWNILPDTSVTPPRFARLGDTTL